VLYHIS